MEAFIHEWSFCLFFFLGGFILHLIGGNTMDMSKSKWSWIFDFHIKYRMFNINASRNSVSRTFYFRKIIN